MPADTPPVRLFQSEFLERLTHTPVTVVPAFWVPVAIAWAAYGAWVWPADCPWYVFPLCVVLGATLIWTLVEYFFHRLVFHAKPRWRWQEEILFLIHGIHHVQPHAKTRLVMPLSMSVPLGWLMLTLATKFFGWLGQPHLTYPVFAGFVLGYVAYDVLHYVLHHSALRNPWLKSLRRHHMEHHFKNPDGQFGVTNEVWDHAFGTAGKP